MRNVDDGGGEPHALTLGRPISDSEIGTLLTCAARWDFRYGGRLAGACLSAKNPALILREGKAWGRAVATYHAAGWCSRQTALAAARTTLREALAEDAKEQVAAGVYLDVEHAALLLKLDAILMHYAATSGEWLNVTAPELELRVPITDDAFLHGFLDALCRDTDGRLWVVEFKLRNALTPREHVVRTPQFIRYVAAYNRLHPDDPVVGIIVDERVNGYPGPVVLRKDGTPQLVQSCSEADYLAAFASIPPGEATLGKNGKPLKTQECSPDVYRAACFAAGVEPDDAVLAALAARREPNPETLDALRAQRWNARHRIIFRDAELADAWLDLESMAELIALYDDGVLRPVRNPHRSRCGSCFARDICDDPTDRELIGELYALTPAKRDRPPLAPIGADPADTDDDPEPTPEA